MSKAEEILKKNPSMQCSVCGQWKRLTKKKEDQNQYMQNFYSCCVDADGEEHVHEYNVCHECCKTKCPYRKDKPIYEGK